jgi:hypothetical protein
MRRGLFVVCLVDFSLASLPRLDFAGRAGNSAGNKMAQAIVPAMAQA